MEFPSFLLSKTNPSHIVSIPSRKNDVGVIPCECHRFFDDRLVDRPFQSNCKFQFKNKLSNQYAEIIRIKKILLFPAVWIFKTWQSPLNKLLCNFVAIYGPTSFCCYAQFALSWAFCQFSASQIFSAYYWQCQSAYAFKY